MDKLEGEIVSLLQMDLSPLEVAERTGADYSKIRTISTKYREGKLQAEVLGQVFAEEKEANEVVLAETNLSAKELAAGIEGLEMLQSDLQLTALYINARVRKLMTGADSMGELSLGTDIVCALNKAFFDKQQVQLNVQNNIGQNQAPAYSQFLEDKPNVNNR